MRTLYTGFRWGFTGEHQEMLVEDGRVVARSPRIDVSSETERVELAGRWMLPSFVDCHCHILATGLDLDKVHLGRAESRDEVLDQVRQRLKDRPGEPVFAVHYDHNRFGGVHLSRDDLDGVSAEVPILLTHVNEHSSVASSAALKAAGVNEAIADPPGGIFVRDANGRLTGVLLETAHDHVSSRLTRPTPERMTEAIVRAGKLMHSQGICCASELMAGYFDLDTELSCYRLAALQGSPIDMRLYVTWENVFGERAAPDAAERLRAMGAASPSIGKGPGRDVRVAGVKIFADGAISSGTAAIYGRFQGPGGTGLAREVYRGGGLVEVDGQIIHPPEVLNAMVLRAHEAGFRIAIHSIGDYGTDLVLDALEETGEPRRHRIEHAMLLEDRQIERMARMGVHCSLQPEFMLGLGASYRRQIGNERAARLIRTRSVLEAGISTSLSSDRPVVAGNPWDGIRAASDRPAGFDPSENCTRAQAIEAYTKGGSAGNGEAGLMGTLEPGSLASFQLLDESPVG